MLFETARIQATDVSAGRGTAEGRGIREAPRALLERLKLVAAGGGRQCSGNLAGLGTGLATTVDPMVVPMAPPAQDALRALGAEVTRRLREARGTTHTAILARIGENAAKLALVVTVGFGDLVGQEPRLKLPPPSARSINRMDETILLLRWLEPELARLVWARAEGTRWKPICWRFGIARATAYRRWEYGLSVIVWRLNGRRVPTKRSRRYVVEGARGV